MTKIHTARVKRFTNISVNQLIRNSMMFGLGGFPTEYRGRQHLLRGWKHRRQEERKKGRTEGRKKGRKEGQKAGREEGRNEGRTESRKGGREGGQKEAGREDRRQ